jgi:hypothetical protein
MTSDDWNNLRIIKTDKAISSSSGVNNLNANGYRAHPELTGKPGSLGAWRPRNQHGFNT